jgi:hypothetical protein
MRRLICAAALSLCAALHADVVRPAPNFDVQGAPKGTSLRTFRGQAVILLITRKARDKQFREEIYRLQKLYSQFSTEKVLFVAAIEEGPQEVKSDIPFILAVNPGQVAADYGFNGHWAIAVIGVDGNVDLVTNRLITAERVRDTVYNNFELQSAARKPIGS